MIRYSNLRQIAAAGVLATGLGSCVSAPAAPQASGPLAWAYPLPPAQPKASAPTADEAPVQLAGSSVKIAPAQFGNLYKATDWFPSEHPPMPRVVAYGRKPGVMACGYCHLPSGTGRPENAALAGLPAAYITEQVKSFRDGTRKSSVAGRGPMVGMQQTAKAITDAEIADAAACFSSLPRLSYTKVVETDLVPKTTTKGWIYSRLPGGGTEPLGKRIIEMPEDFTRFEERDPKLTYFAYVSKGSVERGAALAKNWEDGSMPCASCHGEGMRGLGNVPYLAGRSPTYIVRQLNNFRSGARTGPGTDLMKPVVAPMRDEDIIDLAAYLGSLKP